MIKQLLYLICILCIALLMQYEYKGIITEVYTIGTMANLWLLLIERGERENKEV